MAKWAQAAFCASLLAWASPQIALAQASPYGIGPLVVGMSLDDVRSQDAKTAWVDLRPLSPSQPSSRIGASRAFELDGLPYGAEVSENERGYFIETFATDPAAPDVAQCHARAMRTLNLLETRFGAFTDSIPGIGFNQAAEPGRTRFGARTVRTDNGVMAVPDYTYEGGSPEILAHGLDTPGGSHVFTAVWGNDDRRIETDDLTSRRIARYGFAADRREQIEGRTHGVSLDVEFQRTFGCAITLKIFRENPLPPPG